jgi:hypothetical protein
MGDASGNDYVIFSKARVLFYLRQQQKSMDAPMVFVPMPASRQDEIHT